MKIKKLGLIMVLAIAVGACNRGNDEEFKLSTTSNPNATNPASATSNPAVMPVASYADVVSKVAPAVVTVHASRRVRQPQQFPFIEDPFLRRFFGTPEQQQPPAERQRQGLGSGVIIDANGYILTNHHVIDSAEQIKVDLNDNRSFDAKLVGADAPSDLAGLK